MKIRLLKESFMPRVLIPTRLLDGLLASLLIFCPGSAYADSPAAVAEAIRTEATRANCGPEGRPLPLASHWNCGKHPLSKGWGPQWQLSLVDQGHYVLPWFAHPPHDAAVSAEAQDAFVAYYEQPIKKAAELRLPLTFVGTQWEHLLSEEPYLGLPAEENPNVVDLDGKIQRQVSPFGPVEPWREVGRKWTDNPLMKKLQGWYPNPPLVIFLSNNEHSKLPWTEVEKSRRYREKFGMGRDDDFKRRVVADGWIERYRALQNGMRDGLVSPAWRGSARFVGYGAFGPEFLGRWSGWPMYSLHTRGQIGPEPRMWDGGSPSYYTHDWNPSADHTVWSPQIEFMNLVFVEQEAHRLNPAFWLEFSVWDGYDGPGRAKQYPPKREVYREKGQGYDPARYGGFVQFGMWLIRPRAVREYRGWTFPLEDGEAYFMAIVNAVDRVHNHRVLREFWRKGELVPNRDRKHPYQAAIPAEYASEDRWFLLDASVNPQKEHWELADTVRVFALALLQGQSPQRRWLVYVHAPLGPCEAVRIAIPDYAQISVDVSIAGDFYLVEEKTGNVAAVE